MTTPEAHPAHDPAPGPAPRRPAWRRWGLALLLVLAVVLFYATGLHRYLSWESVRVHLDLWQSQTREHFVLALLIFFALYVTITSLSLPVAALLTLVAGALFGRWAATAVVSAASTLGATLAFLTSRYLFGDAVRRRFGARLGPVDRGVARDGGYYLFTLRLIPAVPFFLINLGMGLTPMRLGTFVAVSWMGMLPGTFLYANAGTELATLDRPEGLLSAPVLGSLALLGLAQVADVIARQSINIDSVIQEPHMRKERLSFVITLEPVNENIAHEALRLINQFEFMLEPALLLPIVSESE